MIAQSDVASALELKSLADCISRAVKPGQSVAQLGALYAYRADEPTPPEDGVVAPVLCVVAQGRKEIVLGGERYIYGPGHFLVNSTHVPATGRTLEATQESPCLWVRIELDPAVIASVIEEESIPEPAGFARLRSVESSPMDLSLLRAVLRLAWCFDSPQDANFSMPLAIRELTYCLLRGEQSARAYQIVAHAGDDSQVARVVHWLRQNFDQPMSIAALSKDCGLSPSVLHQRFRELTAMSPLQYQKRLRLQEAKRLILGGEANAAEAAFRVGYDSPSHFSRDYKRLFGDPPMRDAERMRTPVRFASS